MDKRRQNALGMASTCGEAGRTQESFSDKCLKVRNIVWTDEWLLLSSAGPVNNRLILHLGVTVVVVVLGVVIVVNVAAAIDAVVVV